MTEDRLDALTAEQQQLIDAITPDDSPMTAAQWQHDTLERGLRTPDIGPGDAAVDFALAVHDFSTGVRSDTGETFHLQEVAANTPVALIFGSYT